MKEKAFFIVFKGPSFGGKIKDHTHVKNMGQSQSSFLAFIDELKKHLFKKLLKRAMIIIMIIIIIIIIIIILIFTILHFL